MSIYEYNEEETLQCIREDEYRLGVQNGQERMLLLIQKMTQTGEGELIQRLTDTIFLKEMYQKYQI